MAKRRLKPAPPAYQYTGRFDEAGARRFAEITTQNVGRPFAIVLDGRILSAPVIREPITGGAGQISGRFSVAEAGVLSALLRAGALPAPLRVIEERSVGPDLGGDAIRAGIIAGLAGFALVCGFMVVLYRGWGMIANLALLLNVALTLGALSALGATLTLPGIAGIILGLGLAVDANVLINERIREERLADAEEAQHQGVRVVGRDEGRRVDQRLRHGPHLTGRSLKSLEVHVASIIST